MKCTPNVSQKSSIQRCTFLWNNMRGVAVFGGNNIYDILVILKLKEDYCVEEYEDNKIEQW